MSGEFRRFSDSVRIQNGPYVLVHVGREFGHIENIWWNGSDRLVEEISSHETPFNAMVFDFDVTIAQTEGRDKFFYTRRNILMQEAMIAGDEGHLNALQESVWKWDTNFVRSIEGMLERITSGVDIHRRLLVKTSQHQLLQLLESDTLSKWAELTKVDTKGDPVAHAAKIIAERLEQIGIELLEKDPPRVVELAPLAPGIERLFEVLPKDMIVAIASGTRQETIREILRAHALTSKSKILNRVGCAIVGEGEVKRPKPSSGFYLDVMLRLFDIIEAEGKSTLRGVDVRDMLFFGDFVGEALDISPDRRHSGIILAGDKKVSPGPLAAAVPSIEFLMELVNKPLDQVHDVTLRRFWLTLHPKTYTARRIAQSAARRALEIMAG